MSTPSTNFSEQPISPGAGAAGTPVAKPTSRRAPRWWLPLVFALSGIAALAVVFYLPLDDTAEANRTVMLYGILVLTLLLVCGWLLLTPATRWWTALGLVLIAGGAVAAIDPLETRFSGDMHIIFRPRWQPRRDVERPPLGDLPPINVVATPTDCPEYRGRNRDGVVAGPALDKIVGPVWKQPCGGGYSSFAIAGNVAVTLEQRRDKEAVVCYDLATGKERWIHQYPAEFYEALGGKGPRSTPTIAAYDVYALGATGLLHCLDLKTGKVKWQTNVLKGNDNVMWGQSGSPLVYKEWVIVNPGVQKEGAPHGTLVAYARATGEYAWSAGKAQAGYSSPMLAKLVGREQIVLFDGEGIAGYDPAKAGKQLWRYPWATQQNINVAQPLLLGGDRIFITSGYGVGCCVLHVTEQDGVWETVMHVTDQEEVWAVKPVWKTEVQKTMRCRFTSPVLWDGYVYGLDEGILACVDPQTGKRLWRDGRYKHGQLLVSGGTLVVLGEQGELALVAASPKGYRELARVQALEAGEPTWNVPTLVNGRAYVRNDREMACYDLTGR